MITVMIVTIVTEVSKKSNDSKLVDTGLIVSTVFMIVNQIPKGLRTQIILGFLGPNIIVLLAFGP